MSILNFIETAISLMLIVPVSVCLLLKIINFIVHNCRSSLNEILDFLYFYFLCCSLCFFVDGFYALLPVKSMKALYNAES